VNEFVTILVTVTDEDIALGEVGNCRYCPVSRAITRHLPGVRSVLVFSERIYVNGRPYTAPRSVREFVSAFDMPLMGEKVAVKEFSFTLEVEASAVVVPEPLAA